MPELPARPSAQYLRKEAKRLARRQSLRLAEAQRLVANNYGFRDWARLMQHVAVALQDEESAAPLFAAVRARDVDAVRRLLSEGANPRLDDGEETPLHAAARRGPLALVEALIVGGALDSQTDRAGRTALDVARGSRARERAAIIALLDRRFIRDPSFRAAVEAIHSGDIVALTGLLDAEPRLLRERIAGPEAYRMAPRRDYFLDPKLFWFVANNPKLVARIAPNVLDVARVMIERGVEQTDLDYTLELTMTSGTAREQGLAIPLARLMIEAGAAATRRSILMAAGHRELGVLRALESAGQPVDAPLAAALGADALLCESIVAADPQDIAAAFALAVINGNLEAARVALDAGAAIDAFLPVHAHSTALHQAADNDDVAMIELLLARGAREDLRDKLWSGTPLDWAIHQGRRAARTVLERKGSSPPR